MADAVIVTRQPSLKWNQNPSRAKNRMERAESGFSPHAHACGSKKVDVSESTGRDPAHDFAVIMDELASFSEELVKKPMIVVATKLDAAQDPERH